MCAKGRRVPRRVRGSAGQGKSFTPCGLLWRPPVPRRAIPPYDEGPSPATTQRGHAALLLGVFAVQSVDRDRVLRLHRELAATFSPAQQPPKPGLHPPRATVAPARGKSVRRPQRGPGVREANQAHKVRQAELDQATAEAIGKTSPVGSIAAGMGRNDRIPCLTHQRELQSKLGER